MSLSILNFCLFLCGAFLLILKPQACGALLLSESFDYGSPDNTTKFLRGDNKHSGGTGWADKWMAVSGDLEASGGIRLDTAENSVSYPGLSSLTSAGGQIHDPFGGASQRLMRTPIDMKADKVYFSALVRRSGTGALSVGFHRSSDGISRYTAFAIDLSGRASTGITKLSDASVALSDGVDYLMVGKLESRSGENPDIASLSVFPISNPGNFLVEPTKWDVVEETQFSGVVLDTLRVTSSGNAAVIDEIRLGDSYADVVGELGIVYEPFDYTGNISLSSNPPNNGSGWSAPWAQTGVGVPGLTTSEKGQSLYFGQSPELISDGSTHIVSHSNSGNSRDFSMAVNLASETLYFTALVRDYDGGAPVARMRAEFRDANNNMRANIGIDGGALFVDGNTFGYSPEGSDRLEGAFSTNRTYLLAMKRTGATIFGALVPADGDAATLASEPDWQVQDDLPTGVKLNSIRLLTNNTTPEKDGGILIDDLRVATDWSAAVYAMPLKGAQ